MDLIADVDFAENTSQRLPCVIVLDGSGSMQENNRIGALNSGLRVLAQDLKDDGTARERVRLLVLRVGGNVEVVTDWTDAIDFCPPEIDARGMTPLGEGIRRALQEIEQQKRKFDDSGIPFNRPWMFVISDGQPNDDGWELAAEECKAAEQAGKVTVFCIGVDGADLATLSRFSNRPAAGLDSAKFREFFVWLSRSAKVGSKTAVGDAIQMPATDPWAVIPG